MKSSLILALVLVLSPVAAMADDDQYRRDRSDRIVRDLLRDLEADSRAARARREAREPRRIVIFDTHTGEPSYGTVEGY